MNTATFLHYPSSLSLLEDGEPDFESGWTGDDGSPYDVDRRGPCPAPGTSAVGDRLDSEDNRTVITESMSVTVSDEEKLQLLNKNTELRRLNAELMKLNQQWDEIYRNTTQRMQHNARALQDEVHTLRQHGDKISLMLEHEKNKKEFYETSLLQEMKRNQKLQEYVRHLEKTMHYNTLSHRGSTSAVDTPKAQSRTDIAPSCVSSAKQCPERSLESPNRPQKEEDHASKIKEQSPDPQPVSKTPRGHQYTRRKSTNHTETDQDMHQLKEQLQALKCQTEIYAADYKTEHTDRERMKMENEKLRKKEREMREQMIILQEQLKIYEDDFQKERSDKQVLQRLLKSRPSAHEPVLVHRCNNEAPLKSPLGSGEHTPRSSNSSRREHRERDGGPQSPPYCIGY
ncbi:uncharacterized protein RCH25_045076 [Pelodytes ibericus]